MKTHPAQGEKMRARVSESGKRFNSHLLKQAIAQGVVDVLKFPNGPCNCSYEELDPDSYHMTGCDSLYATIELADGQKQVVLTSDLEL